MAITRFSTSNLADGVDKYQTFLGGRTAIPSVPTIGTATDLGTGTDVSVAFTAGYYPGDYYTALSNPGSITATSNQSPITVAGLTAGTAYTFQVSATNATGTSAYSAASNSVTPAVPPSFESIATLTPSGTATFISFSSIPQTYKHLQIRYYFNNTSYGSGIDMTFNGSSTATYAWHSLDGFNNTARVQGNANKYQIPAVPAYNGASANGYPTVGIIDILDYADTTKNKTVRIFTGQNQNDAYGDIGLTSGVYLNTSAITSITFGAGANYGASNNTFALYGIKG